MTSKLLSNYSYSEEVIKHGEYDYIYLSPHLDDVAFSCAGTICTHIAQGFRILVVTLFAADPQPPFPPLAQAYHQLWQVSEGVSPYQIRKAEDKEAMLALGVDYLWLNWLEVIYRISDLTDLSDINALQTDFHHDPVFPMLCQWLADLHATYPDATIVVPLGIGGHRDHCVLFQAALNVLEHSSLLFFEDFPYVAYQPEEITELVKLHNLVPVEIDISQCLEQRIHVAGLYQSQHAMLFFPPSSYQDMIRAYAQMGEQDSFMERYWRFSE